MFDVGDSLRQGFEASDRRLEEAQRDVAGAQTHSNGESMSRAMAAAAGSVLFDEALLAAVRARLQEIQTATKT